MADSHLNMIRDVVPSADGCEDCLRIGSWWVHLRLCLTCGHVGCCDSSPHRHARQHFHHSGHPIIQSFEPGEDWRWCYVDQAEVRDGDREISPAQMPNDWRVRSMTQRRSQRGIQQRRQEHGE